MKTKTVLLIVVLVVFFVGIVGAGYYTFFYNKDKAGNTLADNAFGWKFPVAKFPITGHGGDLAYSTVRNPGGTPQGLPVRLKIPTIDVDSAIEDALITPDGRMDVPAGSKNVAWFSLGPHPGQIGSAVIGGHFGISDGVPFVFYNLDKLKVGDKVYIVDDKDNTLTFVVRSTKLFNRDDDATTVFTSDDGLAHLNLITCEGIWNRVNDTYPERRVVFTDAILERGASPVGTTFRRSLTVGSSGADVVALQTVLEGKGFFTMPSGVSYGLFGGVTRVALTKYQVSVGLPAVGVLGPLTMAKLNSELESSPVLPNAGTEVATSDGVESLPTPLNTLASSIKSLYATPLDGLITFLLLISIAFVAFKIIRRWK